MSIPESVSGASVVHIVERQADSHSLSPLPPASSSVACPQLIVPYGSQEGVILSSLP